MEWNTSLEWCGLVELSGPLPQNDSSTRVEWYTEVECTTGVDWTTLNLWMLTIGMECYLNISTYQFINTKNHNIFTTIIESID